MTSAEKGVQQGRLERLIAETNSTSETPCLVFDIRFGTINANLTVGVDLASAKPLKASEGICSMGPALGARGFFLSPDEEAYIKHTLNDFERDRLRNLRNGDDLIGKSRGFKVIDLSVVDTEDDLRVRAPHFYQKLKQEVFPSRSKDRDPRLRKFFWWKFRRTNQDYFSLKSGLERYIATVETAKYRLFQFVDNDILLEHGTIGIGSSDGLLLALLSARIHVVWSLAAGGTLRIDHDTIR